MNVNLTLIQRLIPAIVISCWILLSAIVAVILFCRYDAHQREVFVIGFSVGSILILSALELSRYLKLGEDE